MINTHSSFLYGFDVTLTNRYLDFVVSSIDYAVKLDVGSYTANDLIESLETKLNNLSSGVTFTVTLNRSTRIITISGSASFDLLVNSGSNTANSAYTLLGIPTASDFTSVTSISGTSAVGTIYQTQFKLQDFIDQEDNRMSRFQTVSKSASGKTTVVSFGTDRIFEFSFKYLTDRYFSNGPIRSQYNALQNFRLMMRHLVQKKLIEFMPDESLPNTFYKCILDSTADSSDGTGYKLQEQYGKNLIGYFELNGVKLRIIED